jgi:hypothetical protein
LSCSAWGSRCSAGMGSHLYTNRRKEVAGALHGTAGLQLRHRIRGIIGQMAEGEMPGEYLAEPFRVLLALIDEPPDKLRLHKGVPPPTLATARVAAL